MSKGIFITGTATDVGKTYVTALIVQAMRRAGNNTGYFKPALSGAIFHGETIECDASYVMEKAGIVDTVPEVVSYIYRTAVSPHLASQMEHNPVELTKIRTDFQRLVETYDYLTVEGCGGIVCPIRWDEQTCLLQEDIIKALGLGCVIVADSSLGAINSAVLTVDYMKNKNIPIKGIILNRYDATSTMHKDNKNMIQSLTNVPILATIETGDTCLNIDTATLLGLYD